MYVVLVWFIIARAPLLQPGGVTASCGERRTTRIIVDASREFRWITARLNGAMSLTLSACSRLQNGLLVLSMCSMFYVLCSVEKAALYGL